jgi:hypothetical protein
MSSIKNKNLLFLGAVILLAAIYGYYTFSTADDAPAASSVSSIVIETPAKTPVSNAVEPVEKTPIVNVPTEATTDEITTPASVHQAGKAGTVPVVPAPEGE